MIPLTPLPTVVEGLLLVLEAISIFAILFLIYAAYLVRRERRGDASLQSSGWAVAHGVVSLGLVIGVLVFAHERSWFGQVWHVPAVLGVGFVISACYYFSWVRGYWRDDRIQYAMLLWTAFWILICLLLGFIYWVSKHGGEFRIGPIDGSIVSQYVGSFAQISGIIIAATMIIITNRHNARKVDDTARQQIYQALELESVKLFQFECNHPELVARLWYPELPARPDAWPREVQDYQLKQYTCQILNLFEMACRFHKQRIFDADVFGSWVIWMWELCIEERFQSLWKGAEGIEYNYVKAFREIVNAGIYFATALPESIIAKRSPSQSADVSLADRRGSFFEYVGEVMGDKIYVQDWLDQSTVDVEKLNRFWTFKDKPADGMAGQRLVGTKDAATP